MNNTTWMLYNKKGDFYGLAEKLGVDPVLIRIMINRGIAPEEMEGYLHPSLDGLNDPYQMKDVKKASDIIIKAINDHKRIRVIGDYDVDGIFSTYILTCGIKRAGGDVSYDIPHRITDGYGMNSRLVEQAHNDGIDLIVTCDNGIKAFDEVDMAKSLCMQVVVTDHHELGLSVDEAGRQVSRIPNADAVVNPHQPDCNYPFPEICGAVVAWKLIQVLYDLIGIRDEAMDFLPFAAFATIGDIMPLCDENRSIVYFGLKALRTVDNPGLISLMERLEITERPLNPYDIGFLLGPCFNASGRLDTALRGVELLLEKDHGLASAKAEQLRNLNDQRKTMTEQGTREAIEILQSEGLENDTVLVVYVPNLHESLAGIVAGRLKEQYYRPVFVLTRAQEGIKGSGRSIPGYSMASKLHGVEELLTRYGGHPMAAGVSLPLENLDEFRRRLNEQANLSDEDLKAVKWIDVPMPAAYVTREFIDQLSLLEPFGESNERPLFAEKDVQLLSARYMGSRQQFVKFTVPGHDASRLEAVYFGDGQELIARLETRYGSQEIGLLFSGRPQDIKLTFTYYPQINSFMGRETLQLRIEDYKISDS